ncbi:unnamed protein product [Durusdinium trenchii]|uniref:Uncharacterized protein n=1 Tax=Durusdinium trenchii TaxID=1381693 RepID=A0ABP0KLD2_9DINO
MSNGKHGAIRSALGHLLVFRDRNGREEGKRCGKNGSLARDGGDFGHNWTHVAFCVSTSLEENKEVNHYEILSSYKHISHNTTCLQILFCIRFWLPFEPHGPEDWLVRRQGQLAWCLAQASPV